MAMAVQELLTLDGERLGSWRLVGMAEGLDAPVQRAHPPPTPAAAHQHLAGRASAFALRGCGDALAALAIDETAGIDALLAGPDSPHLAGPLLSALLPASPAATVRLLRLVPAPFIGWPGFVQGLEEVASAQLDQDPVAAGALLRAGDEALVGWTPSLDPADQALVERAAAQLAVGRVACHRRAGDFVGARRVASGIDTHLLTADARGGLAEEVALAAAELPCWQATPLATLAGDRERTRTRLRRAETEIEAAIAAAPGGVAGRVLRAGLALAQGAIRQAAVDLAVAHDALRADNGRIGEQNGGAAVQFHLGLAQLCLLEPGTDEVAHHHIESAVLAGYVATAPEFVLAAQALDAHGSPAALTVLRQALTVAPGDAEALGLAADLARRSVPGASGVAAERGRDERLARRARFELLDAALTGSLAQGDGNDAEQLIDDLERLVVKAADADLDRQWAGRLGQDDALRAALGDTAVDLVRLHTLRRAGATAEAAAIARSAYHRALAGDAGGADPMDLLELLEQLGADELDLEALRRLLPRSVEAIHEPQLLERPVRVVFVGGDETQARAREPVRRSLFERYGDLVNVEWFAPGWSPNWTPEAEAIERRLSGADALVLMPLVRTLLGRRLRRSAGQAGIPWVACTGQGRASMERAIDRSVNVTIALGRDRS
jgi:hypothetical protein